MKLIISKNVNENQKKSVNKILENIKKFDKQILPKMANGNVLESACEVWFATGEGLRVDYYIFGFRDEQFARDEFEFENLYGNNRYAGIRKQISKLLDASGVPQGADNFTGYWRAKISLGRGVKEVGPNFSREILITDDMVEELFEEQKDISTTKEFVRKVLQPAFKKSKIFDKVDNLLSKSGYDCDWEYNCYSDSLVVNIFVDEKELMDTIQVSCDVHKINEGSVYVDIRIMDTEKVIKAFKRSNAKFDIKMTQIMEGEADVFLQVQDDLIKWVKGYIAKLKK